MTAALQSPPVNSADPLTNREQLTTVSDSRSDNQRSSNYPLGPFVSSCQAEPWDCQHDGTPTSQQDTECSEFVPPIPPGSVVTGHIEPYLLEELFQGCLYGVVFRGRGLHSGDIVAVKLLVKDRIDENEADRELPETPLAEVFFAPYLHGHPNILTIREVFEVDLFHFVVSDFARGEDLLELLKLHPTGMPEDFVRFFMLQAAQALSFSHSKQVAMHDFSLENCLLFVEPNGCYRIRVCDPGQAVRFLISPEGEDYPVNYAGCVGKKFRPPEIFTKRPYSASRVDSWCLGWSTFYLLFAVEIIDSVCEMDNDVRWMYFRSNRYEELFNKLGIAHRLSPSAKDFILRLMHPIPELRMTIADALNHPFLNGPGIPESLGPQDLGRSPNQFMSQNSGARNTPAAWDCRHQYNIPVEYLSRSIEGARQREDAVRQKLAVSPIIPEVYFRSYAPLFCLPDKPSGTLLPYEFLEDPTPVPSQQQAQKGAKPHQHYSNKCAQNVQSSDVQHCESSPVCLFLFSSSIRFCQRASKLPVSDHNCLTSPHPLIPRRLSPVPKTSPPVPKTSSPVPKTSSPVLKTSSPVLKTSSPVLKTSPLVLKTSPFVPQVSPPEPQLLPSLQELPGLRKLDLPAVEEGDVFSHRPLKRHTHGDLANAVTPITVSIPVNERTRVSADSCSRSITPVDNRLAQRPINRAETPLNQLTTQITPSGRATSVQLPQRIKLEAEGGHRRIRAGRTIDAVEVRAGQLPSYSSHRFNLSDRPEFKGASERPPPLPFSFSNARINTHSADPSSSFSGASMTESTSVSPLGHPNHSNSKLPYSVNLKVRGILNRDAFDPYDSVQRHLSIGRSVDDMPLDGPPSAEKGETKNSATDRKNHSKPPSKRVLNVASPSSPRSPPAWLAKVDQQADPSKELRANSSLGGNSFGEARRRMNTHRLDGQKKDSKKQKNTNIPNSLVLSSMAPALKERKSIEHLPISNTSDSSRHQSRYPVNRPPAPRELGLPISPHRSLEFYRRSTDQQMSFEHPPKIQKVNKLVALDEEIAINQRPKDSVLPASVEDKTGGMSMARQMKSIRSEERAAPISMTFRNRPTVFSSGRRPEQHSQYFEHSQTPAQNLSQKNMVQFHGIQSFPQTPFNHTGVRRSRSLTLSQLHKLVTPAPQTSPLAWSREARPVSFKQEPQTGYTTRRGVNNVGHVITNMGHGINNVGHGINNVGHVITNMGHGINNVGHGINNVGHGINDVGHGIDNVGHRINNVGHGINNMGHVMNNIEGGRQLGQSNNNNTEYYSEHPSLLRYIDNPHSHHRTPVTQILYTTNRINVFNPFDKNRVS